MRRPRLTGYFCAVVETRSYDTNFMTPAAHKTSAVQVTRDRYFKYYRIILIIIISRTFFLFLLYLVKAMYIVVSQ